MEAMFPLLVNLTGLIIARGEPERVKLSHRDFIESHLTGVFFVLLVNQEHLILEIEVHFNAEEVH